MHLVGFFNGGGTLGLEPVAKGTESWKCMHLRMYACKTEPSVHFFTATKGPFDDGKLWFGNEASVGSMS